MPEESFVASEEPSSSSPADICEPSSATGTASNRTTSDTSGDPGAIKATDNANTAHETSQPAEHGCCCVRGINQLVLVVQPDDSTQYVLLSEDRALREAAAKQAAQDAEEQGLVPVDPRDAAMVQAIEDGDEAVRRVFLERLQASLHHNPQCLEGSQPSEGDCGRSQGDVQYLGRGEEAWLAQLEAADMALTTQLNSRDAALSARI